VTAPLEPRTTWWEDEGRRIAAQLGEVSAVLVAGTNAEHAARVALGIARAESERRHVALGDLTGDAAPLYAVAGGEDAFGLSDCLRQGLPLNDIARPAPDRESLFILPAGSPPVACEEILAHERWPRLVNGFAKVGALLMLVARPGTAGFDALAAATGGVVLVDVPAGRAPRAHVLATVAAPEPARAPDRTPARRPRRASLVAFAVLVAIVSAAWFGRSRIRSWYRAAVAKRAAPSAASAPAAVRIATAPADTVRLTDPVNPADTSSTSPYAVEVMAANTVTGANSWVTDHGDNVVLGDAAVTPVAVGGSASVWYKVVVGASHGRAGADSILAALRHDGMVRGGEGRVVKVPYALLLAENVDRVKSDDIATTWRKRGFNPYMLVQADGSVRVLAGAFETPAQAAPLASALRAAGVAPVLAFRTGRTY
jgi:hypothetical protein